MPTKKRDLNGRALITGFPGFITSLLLDRLMARQPKGHFTLLVQRKFMAKATDAIASKRQENSEFSGTIEVVEGDITDAKLGLDTTTYAALQKNTSVVWHLAAIYDLAVPEAVAYKVNVQGTTHIADFCEGAKKLARLNYISTCFVAGTRVGRIFEDELDEGQTHNNHYESTKFWAEMEIQRRLNQIPTAIFRPSIVVGHSKSGETHKYDGPYYLLKFIKKLPRWAPFPKMGLAQAKVNIVPVDFVVNALVAIGLREGAEGRVYQLADPNPLSASELVDLCLTCLERAPSKGVIPVGLINSALQSDTIEEMVGMPREVVNYFTHDASYDTRHTQEMLLGEGVECPHLTDYMQTLIDYFEMHPNLGFNDDRRI